MQQDILQAFTLEVVNQTEKIKIGDPLLEDTRMGPLINGPHLEKVLSFVKQAKEQVRESWGYIREERLEWELLVVGGSLLSQSKLLI